MNKEFLLQYLNTDSPVMYESKLQEVWAEELRPFVDELHSDNYGNVWGIIKAVDSNINTPISELLTDNNNTPYKVLLDAHCDEISFIINGIGDDGLIYPIRNGGIDMLLSASREVTILSTDSNGRSVEIDGYFGWLPIHHKDEKHKDIKPENLNVFIDIGCSNKEEVNNLGVKIGDPIVYKVTSRFLNGDRVYGKSLDDKIGGVINIEVARYIFMNDIKLPYDLYILNSTMEEVGCFGAQIAISAIKPDVAIVFDVIFDSSNPLFSDGKKTLGSQAVLGDGVVIMNGASVQKNLRQLIINTAIKNNIKHVLGQSVGYGGTNADRMFLMGVCTALLSIPLKYMHTTVETISIGDAEAAIELIAKVLQAIKYKHDFKFHKF